MEFLNKQKPIPTPPEIFFGDVKPHTHQRKIPVYLIGVLLSLLVFAIILYIFSFLFIVQKKDVIIEAVNRLYKEQLKETQLRALTDSFRKTETKHDSLSSQFVASQGVVGFIEDIENIGRRGGVWLEFQFVNLHNGELTTEFKVLGSFNEMFYFLNLLEHAPFHIILRKFFIDTAVPSIVTPRKNSDTWYGEFTIILTNPSFFPPR